MRSFFTLALVLGTVLGLSTAALAEQPAPAPRKVIELPVTVFHGTVPRPAASYILTRSGQSYEVRELRTSFVREVVRSTSGRPF